MSLSASSPGHDTSAVRSSMQPRRPASVGKIEKAKDARGALTRLLPYLTAFRFTLGLVLFFVLIYTILGLIKTKNSTSPRVNLKAVR